MYFLKFFFYIKSCFFHIIFIFSKKKKLSNICVIVHFSHLTLGLQASNLTYFKFYKENYRNHLHFSFTLMLYDTYSINKTNIYPNPFSFKPSRKSLCDIYFFKYINLRYIRNIHKRNVNDLKILIIT